MERVSKMGSPAERQALIVYPDKVKDYLQKYISASPSGRYASRARELLSAVGRK